MTTETGLFVPSAELTVCLLASGSGGNAIFISDQCTSVLVDAGLSGKQIERRLGECGRAPQDLDAIIVSHEHQDHIQGAGVLARRYQLPLYISHRTHRAGLAQLGKVETICYFECGRAFCLGQLEIHPFSLCHDAADPAGFTFSRGAAKIGLATDLGQATTLVREHLHRSQLLVLEANHDPDMLLTGAYPWPVKQRIKSRSGHLSNQEARNLLASVRHDDLQHVVLAHLSQDTNTPEKALAMVGEALTRSAATLSVARQDCCSRTWSLAISPTVENREKLAN